MNTLQLSSITAEDLNELLESETGFNVLLGSGISRWMPDPNNPNSTPGIPTGQDITNAIVEALFEIVPKPTESDMKSLKELLMEFPFEAVFDCCPHADRAEDLIRTLCSGAIANQVHHGFAQLAHDGTVRSIITTNYDGGLDDALRANANPIARIVDPPCSSAPIPTRAYFKVHGSVESPSPLIISIRREGMMPPMKKRLLRLLLHGAPLLVVGYSGLDFEVCPEIPSAGVKRVMWNFLKREEAIRSPGLKRLYEAGTEVHVLLGDMSRIMELLGHPVILKSPPPRVREVRSLLERQFSIEERLVWRASVLNFIGHARLARQALAGLSAAPHSELARCAFHEGRYRRSMKFHLAESQLALDDRRRRLALLEASDAARCIGKRIRAKRYIDYALAGLDSVVPHWREVRGRSLLKRILVQREHYLIATKLRRLKHADRLRQETIPWFREAAAFTLEVGDLPEWQQLRLWAERMSVPLEVLRPLDGYAPPATQVGYRHLGYWLALNMDLADRGRAGLVSLSELERGLADAEAFGSNPQAWKLCHSIIKRFPRQILRRLPQLIRHNLACEYTLMRRFLGLAGGS